jgi:uncharacterized membrane protein YbhN (UPF0104 family)
MISLGAALTAKWPGVVATAFGCMLAAYLFARLLTHSGPSATWHALVRAGPWVGLALLPFALGMTIDAYGTRVLLHALGSKTTLGQMLLVRIASEALHGSIPAGFVASDTATAVLLEARFDVPMRDGVVASIARKWLVMRAHAAYIVVGAIGGFAVLAVCSRKVLGSAALPWLVLASASVPLCASWALRAGLLSQSRFTRLQGALGRIPSRRVRRWAEARRPEAVATDAQVARLHGARKATSTAALAFFGCWCVEALESVLLLRLVGAAVPFAAVIAVEGGLSLVRSLAVVAPSGLGVVDFGYATILPVLGADSGSATAFVLLKRAKELTWIAVGYAILGALRGRAASGLLGRSTVTSASVAG